MPDIAAVSIDCGAPEPDVPAVAVTPSPLAAKPEPHEPEPEPLAEPAARYGVTAAKPKPEPKKLVVRGTRPEPISARRGLVSRR